MCISITWEHYNLKQVFPSKIIHKSLYKLQHYKSSGGLSIKTADIAIWSLTQWESIIC